MFRVVTIGQIEGEMFGARPEDADFMRSCIKDALSEIEARLTEEYTNETGCIILVVILICPCCNLNRELFRLLTAIESTVVLVSPMRIDPNGLAFKFVAKRGIREESSEKCNPKEYTRYLVEGIMGAISNR